MVTGAGIHPFRLDMTIDQVVEAAKGWVTTKVKRDPALGALHISLRLGRKRLIVGLLDVLLSVSGSKSHYRVYSISSRDAILPDGRRLEKLSAEELVSYFKLSTEELASHPWDDDDNGFSGRHFDSNDKETSIFFWNGERAELTISRIPELG